MLRTLRLRRCDRWLILEHLIVNFKDIFQRFFIVVIFFLIRRQKWVVHFIEFVFLGLPLLAHGRDGETRATRDRPYSVRG